MSQTKPANANDAYGTDPSLEVDGVIVEFRAGIKVRIRSQQTKSVRDVAQAIAKSQRHLIMSTQGQLPPEKQDANDVELCAKRGGIVANEWNLEPDGAVRPDIKGQPDLRRVSYEEIKATLTRLAALRRDIMIASHTDETFRKQETEEMAGNSVTLSEQNSDLAGAAPTS